MKARIMRVDLAHYCRLDASGGGSRSGKIARRRSARQTRFADENK